jgi:hypothetical protein
MATTSTVDIGAVQRKESGSPAPNTSYVDIGASQRSGAAPPAVPDWFAVTVPALVLAPPRVAPTWFTLPPLPQPNPPPVYCFRRPCTTAHAQAGGSDSLNFKVPVFLFDPSMKTVAHGGNIQHTDTAAGRTVPADLAFFADSALTIPLVFEVELYDGLNGSLRAWVNLPTLSHTADVVFYLAYGSAAVTTFQGNIAATWANNFAGVWHLPTGSTNYDDSTGHGHTGTASGSVTPAGAGVFDGCSQFFGTGDKVDFGASADWNFAGAFTVSLWFQTTDANATLLKVLNGGGTAGFEILIGSTTLDFFVAGGASAHDFTTPVNDGAWHHVVGRWTPGSPNGTAALFLDGSLLVSNAFGTAALTSTDPLQIGVDLTGFLDEPHLVSTGRSDDWITAEYNSQVPGSTFLTVGSETFLCGVTVVPTIYPDWLARVPQTRGWYAAPPAPPVAPPWISVDAPDQVRRGETGRLGWDTRPLLPPPAPAPTYFTDTFPDQVRSGVKAPEGWYTRPTTPPPAPPLIETTLPQARYSVPLTRTTYTAPVTPPAAPAPTYFVDVFPDQVRRAGHAAPDWLAEPILPPPVPYTEWGQTEPLHLRVSWRDLSDYTEPLRIIQNPVPPLSWGVIYPDHLTVVRSAALLGAAYHAPYGPTPPPHERPLYRRSLQLRIGSRTEPEKL